MNETANTMSGPSATAVAFSECGCHSDAVEDWLWDAQCLIISSLRDELSLLVQAANDQTLRPAWLDIDRHKPCYTINMPRLPLNIRPYWHMMRDHLSLFLAEEHGYRDTEVKLDGDSFKVSILFPAVGSNQEQTTDNLPFFPPRPLLPQVLEPADAPSQRTFLTANPSNTSENAQPRPHVTAATDSLILDASDNNNTSRVSGDSLVLPACGPCGSCLCCLSVSASSLAIAAQAPRVIVPAGHDISISIGPHVSYVVTQSQLPPLSSLKEGSRHGVNVSMAQAVPNNHPPLSDSVVHTVSFPPPGGRQCGRCICCSNSTASAPAAVGSEGFRIVTPPDYQVSTDWNPTTVVTVSYGKTYALGTSRVKSINDAISGRALAFRISSIFIWLLLLVTLMGICMSQLHHRATVIVSAAMIHDIREILRLLRSRGIPV
ncbi:hypothetical protein FPV67DRAFT_931318 [Lyophyllum atratum]|nr:hypothetical protein FPV67DRAFT_931318 [Lyophyllum atratum]